MKPASLPEAPARGTTPRAALVLTVAVFACSIYANLSFAVTDPEHYAYFPPFQPRLNANWNDHLGAEYFNIARSMNAGQGFASPFGGSTGPTAWMPPVFPALLSALLWVSAGSRDVVMAAVILLQVCALVVTGLLVLALARRTTRRVGAGVVVAIFLVSVLCNFSAWFQFTHDYWLILLGVDLLIAGLCWGRPFRGTGAAAIWGLFGGLCALLNPVLGFTWGVLSSRAGWRRRRRAQLGVAFLCAGLALAPWALRNYLVFGRFLPVKSNAAYELYQSQCLQADGLLRLSTFHKHPYAKGSREGQEYRELGETAFLDRKSAQFWDSVRADPADFLDRVACRLLGVTLWYVPLAREDEARRPWTVRLSRLAHPLPFLALLVLVFTAYGRPLRAAQWSAIGVYVVYLLPYVGISYYERYGLPLLAAKVLLVIWACDRLLSLRTRAGAGAAPDCSSNTRRRPRVRRPPSENQPHGQRTSSAPPAARG